ncbi:MAG: NAD(P)H-dependent oxidoreductase [Chitinispirillales bacterium]|jgi:flavodoxin|nr:NAD(P)H-dependent oxidoreductase [Chitinispirillales bacterium]
MKTAVVYYSLDGNTAFVCNEIAKTLDADKFVIELKKELPNGFMKYVLSLIQLSKIPGIADLDFNSDNYDKIILGSPCWAWSVAPAMKSFIEKYPLRNKEIALLLCHGGGASEKTIKKWTLLLDESNKIAATLKLVNPLKFQSARAISFVKSWAKNIWDETK